MNAAGNFVPPELVFPRTNMKAELLDGTPPGTIAASHPSDGIQHHIFTDWLQHFIKVVKPTVGDHLLFSYKRFSCIITSKAEWGENYLPTASFDTQTPTLGYCFHGSI
ncbi:hypothetical protein PR048_001735 [Dryococelus australis]|uniref:Uncharacterized protein n=1 Tax=Dryococelus australis TaxID=614101 RepID=A0ABQ9IJ83_9NEOP|nr:hypothetical protein PR048_001735 [Dryococelus australis]